MADYQIFSNLEDFQNSQYAGQYDSMEDYNKWAQGQNSPGVNWWDPIAMAGGYALDKYKTQGPSQQALQQSINPLEESYANFKHMAEQYRDPSSAMNTQMRNTIRGQNLEGMTDIARRASNEAIGTVDDSATTKQMGQNAISTAISNALENYNEGQFKRQQIAADYDAKAGSAAHTLSTARQQNLAYEQGMREKQASSASDWLGQGASWLKDGGLGEVSGMLKNVFNF